MRVVYCCGICGKQFADCDGCIQRELASRVATTIEPIKEPPPPGTIVYGELIFSRSGKVDSEDTACCVVHSRNGGEYVVPLRGHSMAFYGPIDGATCYAWSNRKFYATQRDAKIASIDEHLKSRRELTETLEQMRRELG